MRAILYIVLAIFLMIADKRWQGFVAVRSALSLPVAPIQYLVNVPTKLIDYFTIILSSHDDLVRENLRLKTSQFELNSQLQRLIAIESENNYLKTLLQSSRRTNGKSIIAELLAVSTEPFMSEVVLNKGRKDQVYLGQTVLDASGLMGQVMEVGPITSRVLLINDSRSGVYVQNVRNGLRANAIGENGSRKIKLLYVSKTADIKIGDLFITSGLGDHYPEGYPVGVVAQVERKPENQFASILLQPSAHLESSRQVLLVWSTKNA